MWYRKPCCIIAIWEITEGKGRPLLWLSLFYMEKIDWRED